jgi:predicted signal transduction protein with EAL and GGDEF domain
MGLRIVAAGVESLEAHLRLAQMGCDEGQGYHYARALDPAGFAAWLRRTEELAGVLEHGVVSLNTVRGLAAARPIVA